MRGRKTMNVRERRKSMYWNEKRTMVKEQPLGEKERELKEQAERLFAFFEEKLRAEHAQMHEAREMRARRQSERSATSPAGNTLGSCIDNAVADQIDNMPEAKMAPEREETGTPSLSSRPRPREESISQYSFTRRRLMPGVML